MNKLLSNRIRRDFVDMAQPGKNQFWRFALVFVTVVIAVALANIAWSLALRWFSISDETMNNLINVILATNLLAALLAFGFAFSKLHGRPFASLLNVKSKFRFGGYGLFFALGVLVFFSSNLLTDWAGFQTFLNNFQVATFVILLGLSIISLGIQSFFEEVMFRGYLLQFFGVRFKPLAVTIIINILLFGLFHLGYGVGDFISSALFAIGVSLITLRTAGIEAASGIHTAYNLVIALFFQSLTSIADVPFSWEINFIDLLVEIVALGILLWAASAWAGRNETPSATGKAY